MSHCRRLGLGFQKLQTLSFLSSFSASKSPPPIVVGISHSAGRGVFATRRIDAGELIHTAEPIVSHPSLYSLYDVCYCCLRKLSKQNANSNALRFCSKQCENQSNNFFEVEKKADWSRFHKYCRIQGLKYPLLVKRLASKVISGVFSPGVLDILQPEMLSVEKISLVSILRVLNSLGKRLLFYDLLVLTEEWYTGVLSRIRINSFRVEYPGGSYDDLISSAAASVEGEAAAGNAVYMLPSLYNHDCDPNVNIIWVENVDAKLKALREIQAGEELRICYIDASMDYEARQTVLLEGFGFRCKCLRCMSKD
ncbi:histone-lysine N-methyltransferase ATXR4 [Dorcoceras hygrometricum]|uniref:Histone-lysine N-methyltransferase ATXR4 n=1 Tax=Dorcoceras hygrometricum TaxID=472368 RepID=A0A2Z7AV34_9LAMI|nr:histone-lysine N-methyltransferase ATXR4 [Dorcoceras hygrometricum]